MGHEVTMSKITQDQLKKKKKILAKTKEKKKKNMVHLSFLTPAMAA